MATVTDPGLIHRSLFKNQPLKMSSDEGQHPSAQTQDSTSADLTTSAQQQAALRMVQTMVTESVKSAIAGLSQELLAVMDQRLTAHQGTSQSSTAPLSPENGAFTPVSSGDSISLPSGGLVPFHSQQHYKACLLHQWPRQVLHSLAQPVASCPACQPYQAPPAVG